jgi:hypothetical protein
LLVLAQGATAVGYLQERRRGQRRDDTASA